MSSHPAWQFQPEQKPEQQKKSWFERNWGSLLWAGVILAILGGGAFWIYYQTHEHPKTYSEYHLDEGRLTIYVDDTNGYSITGYALLKTSRGEFRQLSTEDQQTIAHHLRDVTGDILGKDLGRIKLYEFYYDSAPSPEPSGSYYPRQGRREPEATSNLWKFKFRFDPQ